MPKIIHIMDYEPRGTRTMDHFILALARELQTKGWETCFAFGAEPPELFVQQLINSGSQYVVIPFPFTNASLMTLKVKLRDFRADVAQTSFLSAFSKPVRAIKQSGIAKKLIVIDHSSGEGKQHRGWKKVFARARGWWVGRVVDALVPVSHAIAKRDIEQVFFPAHKVNVVYNGIRLGLFNNPVRVQNPKVRVVYAGQLIPEKGVHTLLQAHELLRKKGLDDYSLTIAGKGNQEQELKTFCASKNLNDVQYVGHVDNVPELFAQADIVVVPSIWFEAFGLVLAEAMACGAACVVSSAGALAEVVGVAGLVFRSGDASHLADQLQNLITNFELRKQLGSAGRKRVEELFTLEKMVSGHIAICEKVVAVA